MANSMSFGGTDLGAYGLTIIDGPIEVLHSPRLSSVALPNAHGSIVKGSHCLEKHLTVPCVIQGASFSDLLDNFHSIKAVFHPRNGDQRIILDYQSGRYIVGRLEEGLESAPFGTRAVEVNLKFICGDPTWYGTTLRTGEVTSGAMTIVYEGSEYTPITITGRQGTNSNSSFTEIYVRNQAMYSTFEGDCKIKPYRLSAGQYIRFDSVREIVEVSMDEVTWIPVMQYFMTEESGIVLAGFPMLKPGVSNTITKVGISSYTNGFWRYEYYDRYL